MLLFNKKAGKGLLMRRSCHGFPLIIPGSEMQSRKLLGVQDHVGRLCVLLALLEYVTSDLNASNELDASMCLLGARSQRRRRPAKPVSSTERLDQTLDASVPEPKEPKTDSSEFKQPEVGCLEPAKPKPRTLLMPSPESD